MKNVGTKSRKILEKSRDLTIILEKNKGSIIILEKIGDEIYKNYEKN